MLKKMKSGKSGRLAGNAVMFLKKRSVVVVIWLKIFIIFLKNINLSREWRVSYIVPFTRGIGIEGSVQATETFIRVFNFLEEG